jgi:hypothetical protein
VIKLILLSCEALFALSFIDIPSAMAWHLQSKVECLKEVSAPDCGEFATAVCKARKDCTLEASKTISACTEWRCELRE